MLNAISSNLEPVRVKDLKGKLSAETDQTRAAEWEVVIAYALSQVGKVSDFGNSKAGNPDYIWNLHGHPLLVEVTAVSDAHFHDINPVDYFLEELQRRLRNRSLLNLGRFTYDFGWVEKNNKIVLGIPEKGDIPNLLSSSEFHEFCDSITSSPDKRHSFNFTSREANSFISYFPEKGYFSGGFRSYAHPQHYRHTPIFNALRSKEKQIRNSKSELPAILVICDNDCVALRPQHSGSNGQIGMRDIVGLFLNGQKRIAPGGLVLQEAIPPQGSRIHAVIWISLTDYFDPMGIKTKQVNMSLGIEFANYASPHIRCEVFVNALNEAFNTLPLPLRTARNANTENRKYPRFYGGYQLTGNKVKLSALTLQRLLTGEISFDEFQTDHKELVRYMSNLSTAGLTLSNSDVEISQDDDDDWINLEFNSFNGA